MGSQQESVSSELLSSRSKRGRGVDIALCMKRKAKGGLIFVKGRKGMLVVISHGAEDEDESLQPSRSLRECTLNDMT